MRTFTIVAALALLAACGDSTGPRYADIADARIRIVSGDGQVAPVATSRERAGDLAPGTSHLRTTLAKGQQVVRQLRGRLSGLCQPAYVLDIPGGAGKVPVGPCHLHGSQAGEAGKYEVEDCNGVRHSYRDVAED